MISQEKKWSVNLNNNHNSYVAIHTWFSSECEMVAMVIKYGEGGGITLPHYYLHKLCSHIQLSWADMSSASHSCPYSSSGRGTERSVFSSPLYTCWRYNTYTLDRSTVSLDTYLRQLWNPDRHQYNILHVQWRVGIHPFRISTPFSRGSRRLPSNDVLHLPQGPLWTGSVLVLAAGDSSLPVLPIISEVLRSIEAWFSLTCEKPE